MQKVRSIPLQTGSARPLVPFLIGLLLLALVGMAGRGASAQAPPSAPLRVRILSPIDGASVDRTELIFSLAVTRAGAEFPLQVRIDDQQTAARELGPDRGAVFPAAPPLRAAAVSEGEVLRRLQVTIPARSCAVSFALGGEPPLATVFLKWAGPQPQYQIRPRLYVLSIGVGAYADPMQPLKYPPKDARDLAAAFKAHQGLFYSEVVTRILIDQGATREDILDGLDWVKKETTQNDVAVVLLAGHGINEPRNGDYYFVPYKGDIAKPEASLISGAQIVNNLSGMAGKVLVFLDSCHAGNVLSPYRARGTTDTSAFVSELLNAGSALVVFAAATGRQTSKENDEWQNGAFTKAVVEGLGGAAARDDTGRITINMLDDYVTNKVKELTQGNQTPATAKPQAIPDFPIAVVPVKNSKREEKKPVPVYKQWKFWAIMGGTAAAAAVAIGVGIAFGLHPCTTDPRFSGCAAAK